MADVSGDAPSQDVGGSRESYAWIDPGVRHVHYQAGDDDDRRNPGSERDERQEEVQRERRAPVLSLAHPAALSTRTTVKGAVCGGLMSKESPQCPTITSAGADRV